MRALTAIGRTRPVPEPLPCDGKMVAGNWKMHGSRAENAALIEAIIGSVTDDRVDLRGLSAVRLPARMRGALLRGSAVALGAQDVCAEARRRLHRRGLGRHAQGRRLPLRDRRPLRTRARCTAMTNALVARKFVAAQSRELMPILCVGETAGASARRGHTNEVVGAQLDAVLQLAGVRCLRRRGDRLRAGLGHRHRPHRHARAGPGSARLHPRAGGRTRMLKLPPGCASCTAAASRPATRRNVRDAGCRRRPDRRRIAEGRRVSGNRAPRPEVPQNRLVKVHVAHDVDDHSCSLRRPASSRWCCCSAARVRRPARDLARARPAPFLAPAAPARRCRARPPCWRGIFMLTSLSLTYVGSRTAAAPATFLTACRHSRRRLQRQRRARPATESAPAPTASPATPAAASARAARAQIILCRRGGTGRHTSLRG